MDSLCDFGGSIVLAVRQVPAANLSKERGQYQRRDYKSCRREAQEQAAAEFDRLRAMARNDAEKIRLAAKAEIEAAERAARVELKALAAKLAVDRAETLVAKEMTPAVQEAMINHFVQSLQGRAN